MNYLAHFHLSDGDADLQIGALLGDFVKGPLSGDLPRGVEQGIVLHRGIDAFSDSHASLGSARQLFDPAFRRYSGIMIDIISDHFLTRHWQHFHHLPLESFSQQVYDLLSGHPLLGSQAQQQAERLVRYDVLVQFREWDTVCAALHRVGQRLRRDNPLPQAAQQLERHYAELENLFLAFYPQLIAHAQGLRGDFGNSD